MKNVFQLARLFAGVMIPPHLLGFVWFLETFDLIWILYGVATLLALGLAAGFPRRYFRLWYVRVPILLLYVVTICLTIPIMLRDLTLINYPDFAAFFLRGIVVVVFALMIVEAEPSMLGTGHITTRGTESAESKDEG